MSRSFSLSTIRLLFFFGGLAPVVTAWGVTYPLAKALAPHLRPMGLTAKAEPGGLEQVKGQIIRILNAMETSAQTGGPDGSALIGKAFEFQPNVGTLQGQAMQRSLVQMWREAHMLGCFNDKNQYTGMITRFSDAGSQAVFEYIVPLDHAPRFSRDISNVRLVAPSKSRANNAADAARDLAYLPQFRDIEREILNAKLSIKPLTNNFGQTKEEAAQIFKEEMERAGAAGQEAPNLKLSGRHSEQPTKRNGYQWIYSIELVNLSQHPTEITAQWWLLGDTELKHLNYLMAEGTEKLQLRSMGTHKAEFKTKAKNHYDGRADDLDGLGPKDRLRGKTEPKYRGAVIRIVHGTDKVIATWTSDPTMARCLSPEPESEYDLKRLPKLYENKPK
jgi:hypothetical protein